MILSSNKLIFYLTPRLLTVFDAAGNSQKVELTQDLVDNQEVVNKDALGNFFKKFLLTLEINNSHVILVLSADLLYEKIFNLSDAKLSVKMEEFLAEVPFETEKVSSIKIALKDKIYLASTNNSLYQEIIGSLNSLGLKVLSVVPITIFGFDGVKDSLSKDEIETVLSSKKLLEEGNFLKQSAYNTPNTRPKKLLYFFSSFALVSLITLLLSFSQFHPFNPKEEEQPLPSVYQITSPQPDVVVTPKNLPPDYLPKEEIRVQVLNGSGISEQAALVKQVLTSLGFVDISLGNTRIGDGQETKVETSGRISPTDTLEVLDELKKLFTQISTVSASPQAQFDLIIITGKYLTSP